MRVRGIIFADGQGVMKIVSWKTIFKRCKLVNALQRFVLEIFLEKDCGQNLARGCGEPEFGHRRAVVQNHIIDGL